MQTQQKFIWESLIASYFSVIWGWLSDLQCRSPKSGIRQALKAWQELYINIVNPFACRLLSPKILAQNFYFPFSVLDRSCSKTWKKQILSPYAVVNLRHSWSGTNFKIQSTKSFRKRYKAIHCFGSLLTEQTITHHWAVNLMSLPLSLYKDIL